MVFPGGNATAASGSGKVRVVGFAGSLRKGSYNKLLLRAAKELAPADVDLEIVDLDGIPPFDQDQEKDPPAIVRSLKSKLRSADAVLFVTPEYNYSVPGVLKNAIDWASRPYGDNSFDGKPAAIMSASIGMLGGARAQYHLRQMMVFLDMHPVNRPEVMLPSAADKFDAEGKLKDEMARQLIVQLLANLAGFARKLKG